MWIFAISITVLLILAAFVDWRTKHTSKHALPHNDVRPGDEENLTVGDNRYTHSN